MIFLLVLAFSSLFPIKQTGSLMVSPLRNKNRLPDLKLESPLRYADAVVGPSDPETHNVLYCGEGCYFTKSSMLCKCPKNVDVNYPDENRVLDEIILTTPKGLGIAEHENNHHKNHSIIVSEVQNNFNRKDHNAPIIESENEVSSTTKASQLREVTSELYSDEQNTEGPKLSSSTGERLARKIFIFVTAFIFLYIFVVNKCK